VQREILYDLKRRPAARQRHDGPTGGGGPHPPTRPVPSLRRLGLLSSIALIRARYSANSTPASRWDSRARSAPARASAARSSWPSPPANRHLLIYLDTGKVDSQLTLLDLNELLDQAGGGLSGGLSGPLCSTP